MKIDIYFSEFPELKMVFADESIWYCSDEEGGVQFGRWKNIQGTFIDVEETTWTRYDENQKALNSHWKEKNNYFENRGHKKSRQKEKA